MQAQLDFVVNDPIKRLPEKVIVHYAGTENVISKSEVAGKVTDDMVKLWRLCGLDDKQIKEIIGFLRS